MFQFRPEQIASMRRARIGDGLAETFDGTPLRASRDPNNSDVLASDPLGNTTRFSFDERGLIGAVTTPMGRTWRLLNDPDGKVRNLINPAGHALGVSYTSDRAIESITSNGKPRFQFQYNERRQLSRAAYADGTTSAIEYDPRGLASSVTDRLGSSETYEYDEHGRLTALADGNGNGATFRYGRWDRPESATHPDGTEESYAYTRDGFLRQIRSPGAAADIERDAQGRPTTISYSDATEVRYQYDSAGRVIEASIAGHTSKFTWDDQGRLTSEQSGELTVGYSYDAAGRLAGLTYPSGDRIEFEWDADSRIALVRDWSGGEHRWRYAPADRGWGLTGPNGLESVTALNDRGLPESISVGAAPERLLDLRFEYDGEDRVESIAGQRFASRRYYYDAEGEVARVESPDPAANERFAYDRAGNLMQLSGATLRVNELNQLTAAGRATFQYDRRGNLIRADSSEGAWQFQYDARNMMTRAESPTGAIAHYEYDAFGRRVRKTAGGNVVRYVWAGEQLIGELPEAGPARDYLYYPGTHTPLAMRVGESVYSYHVDHLGTPRALSGPDGSLAWAADYTAFGAARLARARVRNPLRAPGQYFDDETGLHYNRFRYYAPGTGRYLTRDPASYLGGLNLYKYAWNNPINQADPLGLWSWKTVVSIAASVAVGIAVVALAPIALPAAIIVAGAAAGAVGFGLNEALNQEKFCPWCIVKEALRGAVVGALAAIPFALLPATAGVLAFMGAGALSGAISYTANWATDKRAKWNWGDFALSVGIGAVTAGAGRFIAGRYAQWRAGQTETSEPPVAAPEEPVPEAPPPREIESLAPGEELNSEGLTEAQSRQFRNEIDNPPPGKTADDVRFERNAQSRANRGLDPVSREDWEAAKDQLQANSARGTEQQDNAREGLKEALGRDDLTNNNSGEVVQKTVTDPKTGEQVTTRPDSIGKNDDGQIDLVHDHKDLSGDNKVVYDDAQMRAQRELLEDPNGDHVVTVSSDSPNLNGTPPEPRPSGPLAEKSDVYYTDENGTVTHRWIAAEDEPGGGHWEPME